MTSEPSAPHDSSSRGPRGPYRKTARRRESIVKAAFEVFATQGYQAGSLQAVADRAGLSQPALFHHFPTKQDLLFAVLDLRDAYTGEDDDATPSGETLRQAVRRQCRANARVGGLVALYTVLSGESVTEGHPAREYFAQRFSRSRADFQQDLEEERAAGRLLPGVDTAAAATNIVALWDGLQTQWLLDPGVDVAGGLLGYLDLILSPDITDD